MRITVPKDTEEEARIYLRAWMELHEGRGIDRTKKMIFSYRIISLVAGMTAVAGMILHWHPIAVGVAGIILGYTGAETAAMMSRMRAWPHNEKYFDWEEIQKALNTDGDPIA